MARCSKTETCASVGRTLLLRRFRRFVDLQSRLFKIRLEIPTFPKDEVSCRRALKDFCGGIIEGRKDHLWYPSVSRLGLRQRQSIGMSLFLFRKVIPSSPPCIVDYCRKMCSRGAEPDEGFLDFCRREVPRLFRPGWDSGYADACLRSVIPTKSCVEAPRADGGGRYVWTGSERGHYNYVLQTLAKETAPALPYSKVCNTLSGGKWRTVSVAGCDMNLLRPLHSTIYNHLSRFSWLLRGQEKATKFSDFVQAPGEVFVSGDYESATDNLNIEVQEVILDSILSTSRQVPKGIRFLAMESQRPFLKGWCDRGSGCSCGRSFHGQLQRGQLMGNLLSFPLLCLVNYLGFRYFAGRHPVKINGDDIVFRAPKDAADRWIEGVGATGLTLSRGKTLVRGDFFTLNSKGFSVRGHRVREVPMVRSTALGLKSDQYQASSLAGRIKSCAPGGWDSRSKSIIRTAFLRENFGSIVGTRRSVTRGLGLPVKKSELVESGLWAREVEYLRLPKGTERALPLPPPLLEQERVPEGWKLRPIRSVSRRKRREFRSAIGPEFVQCAWSPSEVRDEGGKYDWKEHVLNTGIFVPFRGIRFKLSRLSRLLRTPIAHTASLLRSNGPKDVDARLRSKMIWCPPMPTRMHRVLFKPASGPQVV